MIHFASDGAIRRPGWRYTEYGIGFPETSRPRIDSHHVDGPLLIMRDGSLHWLTVWERFRCWIGIADAMLIEHERRPDLAGSLDEIDEIPCMFCGGPVGPHAVGDENGDLACKTCGDAEIAAQRAEGHWPCR